MGPAAAAAMVVLLCAPSAQAKVDWRVKVTPSRLHVGQTAALELRLHSAVIGAVRKPAQGFPRNYPFNVVAIPPKPDDCYRPLRIRIRPTEHEWIWRGSVRLPHAGRWTIRILNFQERANPCMHYPSNPGVIVTVVPRNR